MSAHRVKQARSRTTTGPPSAPTAPWGSTSPPLAPRPARTASLRDENSPVSPLPPRAPAHTSPASSGTYSNAFKTSCDDCEAGEYSESGTGSCLSCEKGSFSAPSSQSCTTCAAGKYSNPSKSFCDDCGAGQYSDTGADKCLQCDAGSFSTPASTTCTTCTPGKYSNFLKTNCWDCDAGKYSSTKAEKCTACPVHHLRRRPQGLFLHPVRRPPPHLLALLHLRLRRGPIQQRLRALSRGRCLRRAWPHTIETMPFKPTYWLTSNCSIAVLKCSNEDACAPPDSANSICKVHHTGPFCESCEPGLALSAGTCVSCKGSTAVVVMVALLLAAAGSCCYSIRGSKSVSRSASVVQQ